MAWYKQQRAKGGPPLSEFGDLTLSMLHTKALCTMTAHAVETRHLMPFLLGLLEKYRVRIGERSARNFQAAGEALIAMDVGFAEMGARPSNAQAAAAYANYKKFMQYSKLAGIPMKPKCHQLRHMVDRCLEHGSPNMYSTFEDEGLNAVLRSVGRAAHRSVWEYRVFQFFTRSRDQPAPGSQRKRPRDPASAREAASASSL